ncbi:methionyl-tRNA formyltransferase [Candidatus Falkowbacteria bacterium]|nr:methionyl-tRNA formyltransferase [Candidatus Falkowbacteria bacterium]
MKKYKIVFFGTPEFAVPSLESLIQDDNFEVAAVVTQKNKPVGRGHVLTPPPVKVFADQKNIPTLQPDHISEIQDRFKQLAPDIAVVVAYGKIIPADMLEVPAYGFINLHGSILPKYRGAAVLQAPILYGDTETGVSIIKMDKGLDTGPILSIGKIALKGDETAGQLHDKLARMGSRMLPKVIMQYINGYIEPEEQKGESKYIRTLDRGNGRINWNKKASQIEKQVRAYTPWPGTFTTYQEKILKILEVDKNILNTKGRQIGEVLSRDGRPVVQTGEGSLVLKKLQIEGKKPLNAEDFLRGHEDLVGSVLK